MSTNGTALRGGIADAIAALASGGVLYVAALLLLALTSHSERRAEARGAAA